MNTVEETRYNINNINPIFGSEVYSKFISSKINIDNNDNNDHYKVKFIINPCADLIITSEIEIILYVPQDYYLRGGTIVETNNSSPFLSNGLILKETLDTNHNNNNQDDDDTVQSNAYLKKGRQEKDSFEIFYPWMRISQHYYPLAVWFFTVRNSLLKQVHSVNNIVTPIIIDNNLPKASKVKINPKLTGGNAKFIAGAGRIQGRRPYMEDVDFVFQTVRVSDKLNVSVFGVLDGHGGKECAQFVGDELPMKIAGILRSGTTCPIGLHQSLIDIDKDFIKSGGSNSGSTANVILFDNRSEVAYIANIGDTRAVVSRSGVAIDLTTDKKATDPDEVARMVKNGGFVAKGRVMGSLAVARALGDCQLKKPVNGFYKGVLSGEPEITSYKPSMVMSNSLEEVVLDEFIISASDGLWDVMTSQAAVNMARDLMIKEGILNSNENFSDHELCMLLSSISDKIATNAVKNLQSIDNVTVMLIRIKGLKLTEVENNESDNDIIAKDIGYKCSESNDSESSETVFRISNNFDDDDLVPFLDSKIILNNNNNSTNYTTIDNNVVEKNDDDMMDFLLDDSNF